MKKEKTCYNCEERHLNCYDTCEYYKKFKKRLDVIKNNRKLYKDLCQINMSKRR